jgi:molecular chaperone GrpE
MGCMNDDNKVEIDISAEDAKETVNEAEQPIEGTSVTESDQTEDSVAAVEEKLRAAEEEAKETYDRLLRLSAEFENFKKRTTREISDFRKYANESLIRELLGVVDNLERALQSSGSNGQVDNGMIAGVELTRDGILKIFEKYNVRPVEALDQPFDPKFHEAVMQEDVEGVPANTVTQELQRGYLMHDRLIRPAMVVVSKDRTPDEDGAENDNTEDNHN